MPKLEPPRAWSPQQILLRSVALFAGALGLRLLHLVQMRDADIYQVLINDPRQYDEWAQQIAAGNWLGSEVFYQTPLYPYLLAVGYSVVGHQVWAIRILQAVFGALACVFLARAGARLVSERAGLCAGILLALYPPAIFFDGILQKASLDLLLMTSLLWVLALAQDRRHWGWFAALGALVGATTLNRENAAALVPVLLLWIGWLSWSQRWRATLAWTGAFVVGTALVLVPVGARNYYVGGLFALTTSQLGTNFYIGNSAQANGTYEALNQGRGDPKYESLDARVLAERDLGRSLSPGEVSRYWLGRAGRDIRGDVARWLRLLGWKWMLTWNRLELVDAESLYTHARYSTVLAVFAPWYTLGLVVPLAVLGAWLTRRDWRRLWPVTAISLTMAAAVTLFYVFARYRYPMVPPLMILAGAGIVAAWDKLRVARPGRVRELGLGATLAILTALVCNVRLSQAFDDDALTFFNAANEFRNRGRIDAAIELWQQALLADPKFHEANHALGRARLAEGNLAEARRYFEQVLVQQPQSGRALYSLGTVLAEQGDEAAADALVERALQASPILIPDLGTLAQSEMEQGRPRAAIVVLRALSRALPDNAAAHAELGHGLLGLGRTGEAVVALRRAIALDPSLLGVANNLAWILATSPDAELRQGAEALALAEVACRATQHQAPELLDTLAAAYAEVGSFEQAVAVCDQALALKPAPAQSEALVAHRAQYASGEPWREVAAPAGTTP